MSKSQSSDRVPFSVNYYICPADVSFVKFLDLAVYNGFSGVGLTERAFEEMSTAEIRRELQVRDLTVSSVNTAGYFLYEGARAEQQEYRNLELLDWCSKLGGVALNVIVGGVQNSVPQHARKRMIHFLSDFCERAKAQHIPLMIESLHPMRFRDRSCINTLATCHEIQEAIPSLKASVDLFHSWWDPDLEDWLLGSRGEVGVLQICDLIGEGGNLKRVPLGEGYLHWSSYVTSAQRNLKGVPIELELFADQLPGRMLGDVLSVSSRSLRGLS